MAFVVKAAGSGFSVMWLTPDSATGFYTFGPRKDAIVFPAQTDAQDAVDKATKTFGPLSMTFTVEAAD
jgi:hypothetical protein